MRLLLLLPVLLLPLCMTQVAAEPQPRPSATVMTAVEIADGLLSRDPAQYDRGLSELQSADGPTCEALGREILTRGVREAESLLSAVAVSGSSNALIAAFVGLESQEHDVRNAAMDAVLSVPFTITAKCDETFLKGQRGQRLFELLTTPADLAARCDALRRKSDGALAEEPRTALAMILLSDRFFGARGFTSTLRALAQVMLGSDIPLPADLPAFEKRRESENEQDFLAREQEHKALELERETKLDLFGRELARRQAAQIMFRTIWIADLTQFNFVADTSFKSREIAVNRILKRLDAMDAQQVTLGERTFLGMRSGDYFMELWGEDVGDVKAAAYLRLRAMAGEPVELFGEEFGKAVSEHNGLNRRQLAELRKSLRNWWTQYRASTEPK